MSRVVLGVLLLLAAPQDPADQLRRQELALRLDELASSGKYDALAKAVLRELRGRRLDGSLFDFCWKMVTGRRWEPKVEEFIAAWDKAAALEAPAPAQSLFRARLALEASQPKIHHDLLEAAAKKFPGEPAILWHLAKSRFDAKKFPATAAALEGAAAVPGYAYDRDEFHRMSLRCYAELGNAAAAVEHLRALESERIDASDLARLAFGCRLYEEAARQFREAVAGDPDRLAYRIGLVRSLQVSGQETAASEERRRMCEAEGEVVPAKVQDYFIVLPPEGRSDEIHRTLRDLLEKKSPRADGKLVEGLAAQVPAEDRVSVGGVCERSARSARDWILLGSFKRTWGPGMEPALEALEKGEKAFPRDADLLRDKLDVLEKLYRPKGVEEAYLRLVEIDPEQKSGPRPYASAQRAVRQLGEVDPGEAIRFGVLLLSDPGLDEAMIKETRVAMRPAWERAGPGFWDEVKKLKLKPAEGATAEALRRQIPRLSDDEFQVRTDASKELTKLGLPAIPKLLELIDLKDVEVATRAREIIRSILSD